MCNVRFSIQAICLSLLVVQIVDSYSFTLSNSTRVRRQASQENCPKPNFKCKSGECINGDNECDGNVDCQDASDETSACRRIKCPNFLFTCEYGACINKDLECDGKPDCRDGSDEKTPNCNTTDDASPKCKENEFRCSSGQCIDQDFKCDGKAECDDHSDEIKATCWNIRCPGYTYKCSYGGCVNGKAECNGIVECFDGSDEDPAICPSRGTPNVTTETPVTRPPPEGQPGSCVLPNHPELGSWTVHGGQPGQWQPGMSVGTGTILRVACSKKQYKLEGNNAIFCDNGQWTSSIGQCLKTCPQIKSTATMSVTCTYKNRESQNCTDAVDGTLAKFKCSPFYEDLYLKKQSVHICQDGSWDLPTPRCEPVCGQKTVDATKLIVNGTAVNKGDYPWQVAIYTTKDRVLICGGSLINQRVILTAAHCVTNDNGGALLSKENYIIAVGKYYRNFSDSRDHNEAQFSEVKAMFIPEAYRGNTQNFLGDIAIIVTKKTFTLSRRVQPVCLDRGNTYNPEANEFGFVTGWGYTSENSKPSDILKEVKVPSVSLSQCRSTLPEDFEVYLTHDKLCAGYIDQATSVCKGDSGGGLVFKHDGRYYITGIVSLSPNSPTAEGGCDSQQYGLYTKVSHYITDFILHKLAEFKV